MTERSGGDEGQQAPVDPSPGLVSRVYHAFPSILMARRNLGRNRIRSVLAALGIVIGVLAIAALGIFGTTLQTGTAEQLGDIGNEISVTPNREAGVEGLTDRDVTEMRRVAEGTVVPVESTTVRLSRGQTQSIATAYGIANPAALYAASDGRVPDRFQRGVLVGATVAERFDLAAGNAIVVDDTTYRVIAVLEEQGGITLLNPNAAVVVPPTAIAGDTYSQVVVTADSGAAANRSAVAIREELNRRTERVSIFELGTITESIDQVFGLINAFLVGVGSISLIVAGVSILNVMLMSTIERRQEIGVLRAVGVHRRQVMRTILAEAALLGVVGGVLGTVLALGVGMALNQYVSGDPLATFTARNARYLVLAFGFALGTSLLSGLYPAWKAANEPPVEALRK
ncbi:ABC-type antimicrobial peptide transport system,permease component [Halanaeroarchaeum sp. HSR-CO]|uniref:ABC transporter permease n=1 Tax=Halanaeroarchaeum sp. HSR-CO TaxID=2866382 RepID=UPI00217D4A9E|nr:ABC transporter permease [Halanaeroarchaeum sp. HSR-CO]UWG46788.1 ABC-type antimicrobial peptide transport system,permease component [Halanaeroarchaeum sp. HSR-CO]